MPEIGEWSQNSQGASPFYILLWGITQFGACLGILMSLGQLALENKTSLNRLLALLFFLMGTLQASILLLASGLFLDFPRLSLLVFPLIGSTGPILFGVYKASIDRDSEDSSRFGLENAHLLLLGTIWILYGAVALLLPEVWMKQEISTFLSQRGIHAGEILLGLPLAVLVFYMAWILQRSRDLFYWEVLRSEWTARILLFIVFSTFGNLALGAAYVILKSKILLLACSATMGFSLCLAYLIGHKRPAFFQTLQEVVEATRQKYARSLLSGVNRNALQENLKQLMERDKLYRDEKLSLADLADELALSTHQVSELINQELGMNFSAFVNDYRIQEACELLKKEPDRSTLDIAFSVGFGTKSSFHRAFQKHTGKTPSEFRGAPN
ncbi:AraC family transcriptional regulator [Leptospira wolffii]|uniref:AraC family transcriptional regulator n=1 Tax=Leptospira wolffii TaxID=409998 RepID=A0A2M9Z8F0_9LEPT|nr:helix-turn-helix domain-containing protein [Leptospira wolffii]PJZ64708.1 AraC family transcriptional regulator [Leptospira wolffii]